MRYHEVLPSLRAAYDAGAAERDGSGVNDWKVRERDVFLELLAERPCRTLLELGSGPGRDGLFFQERGVQVTCTDLSPAMIAYCRDKGLEAHVMDFLNLELDRTFDAVFALNSLLHVPKADLRAVLARFHALLNPGGLLFWRLRRPRFRGNLDRRPPRPQTLFRLLRRPRSATARDGVV